MYKSFLRSTKFHGSFTRRVMTPLTSDECKRWILSTTFDPDSLWCHVGEIWLGRQEMLLCADSERISIYFLRNTESLEFYLENERLKSPRK
jgi:hypothetical protein